MEGFTKLADLDKAAFEAEGLKAAQVIKEFGTQPLSDLLLLPPYSEGRAKNNSMANFPKREATPMQNLARDERQLHTSNGDQNSSTSWHSGVPRSELCPTDTNNLQYMRCLKQCGL